MIASVKNIVDAKVGDTITDKASPASGPLPGYVEAKSMVFSGFYPIESDDYEDVRDALEMMAQGRIDRRSLVTHEFPIEEADAAFEAQTRYAESVKVVIHPGGQ